jgi:hypothetical protein
VENNFVHIFLFIDNFDKLEEYVYILEMFEYWYFSKLPVLLKTLEFPQIEQTRHTIKCLRKVFLVLFLSYRARKQETQEEFVYKTDKENSNRDELLKCSGIPCNIEWSGYLAYEQSYNAILKILVIL